MSEQRVDFIGLKCTKEDFLASLKSDYVLTSVVIGTDIYVIDVKAVKKVQGYYDFWKIEGNINGRGAQIFVDYFITDTEYPEGGIGYLEFL